MKKKKRARKELKTDTFSLYALNQVPRKSVTTMQRLSGRINSCRLSVGYSIMRSRWFQRGRKGEIPADFFQDGTLKLLTNRLIGVGFCTRKVILNRLPGWEPESWGYHGDDGNSFCCQGTGKPYGPQFSTTDIIGCGVNFRTGTAFFTKNGVDLGIAFRDIKSPKLYPAVGMKRPGEHIRVNFGQERFIFDIDHYMNVGAHIFRFFRLNIDAYEHAERES